LLAGLLLTLAASASGQGEPRPGPIRWMFHARPAEGSGALSVQLPNGSGVIGIPGSSWRCEYGRVVRQRPPPARWRDPHTRRIACGVRRVAVEIEVECDTLHEQRPVRGGTGGAPPMILRERGRPDVRVSVRCGSSAAELEGRRVGVAMHAPRVLAHGLDGERGRTDGVLVARELHGLAHADCPRAKPCIGRCGRLTTAHETQVPGYCPHCAADEGWTPLEDC